MAQTDVRQDVAAYSRVERYWKDSLALRCDSSGWVEPARVAGPLEEDKELIGRHRNVEQGVPVQIGDLDGVHLGRSDVAVVGNRS